jgi:hypothetical protein
VFEVGEGTPGLGAHLPTNLDTWRLTACTVGTLDS